MIIGGGASHSGRFLVLACGDLADIIAQFSAEQLD